MSNKTITLQVKQVQGLKNKSIGLLGKEMPEAIQFKTRFGIHTFGMKFPIDVIILDKNHRVKKLKKNMNSNRIFFWNPCFENVLELPVGIICEKKISINDTIIYDIMNL